MFSGLKKLGKGAAIAIIIILVIAVVVGLVLGCFGTVLSIPVWIAMWAFNAIVPAFVDQLLHLRWLSVD